MSVYFNSNSRGYAAQAIITVIMLAACCTIARAQSQQPPFALFQFSSLTASGNTITAAGVPVITGNGVPVYENLTLQFNVDGGGNLTIANLQAIPAPTILTSGFKAGTYVGPPTVLSGKMIVVVSGPGVTDGGATQWSIATGAGADGCTFPLNASWYVGPLNSSPVAARVQAAGITSTTWSYGVFNGPNCGVAGFVGNAWYPGTLIGVSQVGDTITIASFSRGGSTDFSVPVDQLVYTHQ